MELFEKVKDASEYLLSRVELRPKIGIIVGTGLGSIVEVLTEKIEVRFDEVYHFPEPTVESHEGKIYYGLLEGVPVVIFAGRYHYYEGYSMQKVTFPTRVLAHIGVTHLIMTNASGSCKEDINAGDIVAITDHINLLPEHPLRGANDDRLGSRFPSMHEAYDKEMLKLLEVSAREKQIVLKKGIYCALQGPSLETPAEYNFLSIIGGSVVGMSTVPEVIVAVHAGVKVAVLSVCTNNSIKSPGATTVEEVIAIAEGATPNLKLLLCELVRRLG